MRIVFSHIKHKKSIPLTFTIARFFNLKAVIPLLKSLQTFESNLKPLLK